MTADEIKYFLRLKYSKTWAFYEEFRPFTGFAGNVNQVDAVAVGLYEKNKKIIAFEIKTDRSDFVDDVSQFQHKHRFALELSHQFFYVCPWGLIDKAELPDMAGLIYINKGNRIQIKKVAQTRVWNEISLDYFQAFLQNSKQRINYADIPVQYLGRNWTQKDFLELIKTKTQEELEGSCEWEIEKQVKKRLEEENAYCLKFLKILDMANLRWAYKHTENDVLISLEKIIKRGLSSGKIKDCVERAVEQLNHLIQEFPNK